MRKTALLISLAAAMTVAMVNTGEAKKKRFELRESDPWFGPAVTRPVNENQIVIYGRAFPKKKRTAYERMMEKDDN